MSRIKSKKNSYRFADCLEKKKDCFCLRQQDFQLLLFFDPFCPIKKSLHFSYFIHSFLLRQSSLFVYSKIIDENNNKQPQKKWK